MKKILFLTLALGNSAFALEEKPWFGDVFEFEGRLAYAYTFFHKIDQAKKPLKRHWYENWLAADLSLTAPERFNWEMQLEFSQTPRHGLLYRSFVAQGRFSVLDDVEGDPFSWTVGLSLRQVAGRILRDFSNPHHARGDFELTTAIGKEWCCGDSWHTRLFAFGAFGFGTRGSPWWRANFYYLGKSGDHHEWRLYGLSYFGLGDRIKVPTKQFKGWGEIAHRSLDLGVGYRYVFCYWGSLGIDYFYRVVARSYPEQAQGIMLVYELPFSL